MTKAAPKFLVILGLLVTGVANLLFILSLSLSFLPVNYQAKALDVYEDIVAAPVSVYRGMAAAPAAINSSLLGLFTASESLPEEEFLAQTPKETFVYQPPQLEEEDFLPYLPPEDEGVVLGEEEETSTGPVSLASLETTAANILHNSSFEVAAGGAPRQWNYQLDSTTGNTFTTEEAYRSGAYGLKFKGEGNGNFGLSQPDVKLRMSRAYVFSLYIKPVNAASATVKLGFWDEVNNRRATMKDFSYSGTQEWHRISMKIDNTAGWEGKKWFPLIEVLGLTSGAIYIDDVQLEEGTIPSVYHFAGSSGSATQNTASAVGDGSILASVDGNLYPAIDDTGSLGLANNQWKELRLSKATITEYGALTVESLTVNNSSTFGSYGGHFLPSTDDTYDLGSSTYEWQDLYIDGTIYTDAFQMPTGATSGYVLSTDASGNATWTDVSSTGGPWTLVGNNLYPDSTAYIVGIGTSSPEGLLEVQGSEGNDAVIYLDADDGDDNADTWIIKSEATGNDLSIVNHATEVLNLTTAGNLQIDGDLTISGDDLFMGTNNDAFLLIADGTNFNPVAMSGDVTITNAGVTAIADDSHAHVYSNIDETTSANWLTVVSDETGTGKWVFSTAPTFDSTIALGTSGGTSGQITLIASDNDQATLAINTSDQLAFAGAVGGYSFDTDVDVVNNLTAGTITSDAGLTATTKVTTPEVEYTGSTLTLDVIDAGTSYVDITNSGAGVAKLYLDGAQVDSDDLSDVASLGMLDEAETVSGAWVFSNATTALTVGAASAGVDYRVLFDGETADGSITYMEDEDRFDFDNDVDVIGDLTAGTITSDAAVTATSNFVMPATTTTTGILYSASNLLLHAYGTRNAFFGINAGNLTLTGTDNVGIGEAAMNNLTSGIYNVGIGSDAGTTLSSGVRNIAIGRAALSASSTGNDNIAIGMSALTAATSNANTAVGVGTGENITTGTDNVAIGANALNFTQTTGYNTAVGAYAGYGVTGNSHSNNTMLGYRAGYTVTTGSNNIFLGYQAGDNITTGANNIVLGYDVNVVSATGSNQLNIGNLIYGDLSNKYISIGDDTTPDTTLDVEDNLDTAYVAHFFNDGNEADRYGIQIQAGADDASGTTYYLNALDGDGDQVGYIANTGGVFALTDPSDIRTKTNVVDTTLNASDILGGLRVVDFNRLSNPDGPTITGFIAQEVQPLFPQMVSVGPDGMLGIAKEALIPVLVRGHQEQQDSIVSLLGATSELETDVQGLSADLYRQLAEVLAKDEEEVLGKDELYILSEFEGVRTGELRVTGAAVFEGELTVLADATFKGRLFLENGVEIKGDLVIDGAIVTNFTAGEVLATGDVVYVSSANKVNKASAASENRMPAVGVVVAGAGEGTTVRVAVGGTVGGLADLAVGKRYFVSTSGGGMTAGAPSDAGQVVQAIGVAKSETQLLVMPDLNYEVVKAVQAVSQPADGGETVTPTPTSQPETPTPTPTTVLEETPTPTPTVVAEEPTETLTPTPTETPVVP